MKQLAIFALCISLAGCAAYQKAAALQISPTQVTLARQAFAAIEVTATNYVRAPLCTAPDQTFVKDQCSKRSAIKRLDALVKVGRENRDALKAYIVENPEGGIGASGLYAALRGTIDAVNATFADYGVTP